MIKNKRGHLEYLIENDMFSDGKIPIINKRKPSENKLFFCWVFIIQEK